MASRWSLQRKSKRKVAEYSGVNNVNLHYTFSEIDDDSRSTGSISHLKKCRNLQNITDTSAANSSSDSGSQRESSDEKVDQSCEREDRLEQEVSTPDESSEEIEDKNSDDGDSTTQELLCSWSVNHNISHVALKDLLWILRERYDSKLPVDPRTLCRTPASISHDIDKICGGEYYHFGLKTALQEFLNLASEKEISNIPSTLQLKVNCDGIPLYKSSSKQFWPILIQFCDEVKVLSDVYIVGIFSGDYKPTNIHEYLKKFIADVQEVKNGYIFLGRTYFLKIHCFICDAPARQFLKCIVSHNAYSGCERCTQQGKYLNSVTFPEINATLRTDDDFIREKDSDHHKSVSPLTLLNIGMVTQFVLDPMHLLYLGVMRKLLHLWLKGPLNIRIGSTCKTLISKTLEEISVYMPDEFSRKPRSLDFLERFKATEFRSFVLYTGPVCLADNIDSTIYKNFLLFSVAVTLMCGNNAIDNVSKAQKLLIAFVKHFSELYGPANLVYNVHNLIHIPDDVAKYGSLDKFSAFPFENHLGLMKKMLRKPNCALTQIVKRLYERKSRKTLPSAPKYPILRQQHCQGPVVGPLPSKQYKEIVFEDFCIKTNTANQGVIIRPNHIGRVLNIVKYDDDSDIVIVYKYYSKYEALYSYPVSSCTLGIFLVSDLGSELKSCNLKDVLCKYILFPFRNGTAAFPVFHTDQSSVT